MANIIHMDTDLVLEFAREMSQKIANLNNTDLVNLDKKVSSIPWEGPSKDNYCADFMRQYKKLINQYEEGFFLGEKVRKEADGWLAVDQRNAAKYIEIRSRGEIIWGPIGKGIDKIIRENQLAEAKKKFTEWWKKLSLQEKKDYLKKLYERIARELGLTPIPLEFPDLQDPAGGGDLKGGYYDYSKEIRIDIDNIQNDSPFDLVNTIAHETRHQYQDSCVRFFEQTGRTPEGVPLDQVLIWKVNGDHYQPYDKNPLLYEIQPVEVDARDFGSEYAISLLEDQSTTGSYI